MLFTNCVMTNLVVLKRKLKGKVAAYSWIPFRFSETTYIGILGEVSDADV